MGSMCKEQVRRQMMQAIEDFKIRRKMTRGLKAMIKGEEEKKKINL